MKLLYAPWRDKYTMSTAHTKNEHTPTESCVFCLHANDTSKDEQNFVLRRYKHIYVMLNLYPYNAGHLLLLPYTHIANLEDLSHEARTELIQVTAASNRILKDTLLAEGINGGYNSSKIAGAGIPAHFHMHVLPRWLGDTNFLPTLAQTKAISFDLHDIYNKLKKEFTIVTIE